MSVQRSPPVWSVSLSDLPTEMAENAEQQVTLRKRKQPKQCCDFVQEVQSFRKDITSILGKFTTNQDNTLKFTRETIFELKSNLNESKISIDTQLWTKLSENPIMMIGVPVYPIKIFLLDVRSCNSHITLSLVWNVKLVTGKDFFISVSFVSSAFIFSLFVFTRSDN